jgi:hypothetical protein
MEEYYFDILARSGAVSILFILTCILLVASRVLLMLAVGFDCKGRGIANKSTWMALMFFFPIIVGIVYLCQYKKEKKLVPKICTACGTSVASEVGICPVCGRNQFADYLLPDRDKNFKARKVTLIVGIIVFIISVVMYICTTYASVGLLEKLVESDNSFGDNYSDFYNFSSDDIDDYEEYFNQLK